MVITRAFGFTRERIRSTTAVNPATTSASSIKSWPRRVRKPKSPGPTPIHQITESLSRFCLGIAGVRHRLFESADAHTKRAGSLLSILRAGHDQFVCAVPSTNSRTPVPRSKGNDEIRARETLRRRLFLLLNKHSNQSA